MPMKRLGVLGTLVRDTIHTPETDDSGVDAGWGGIAYGLEALEVSLPEGWEVVPLVRVGDDRAAEAREFLEGLGRVVSLEGVRAVPEPTNRVEIRYRSDGSRLERLTGGVPPWPSAEAREAVADLDALYINFISGFELTLPGAEAVRKAHPGPVYADLHSLFLSVDPEGFRRPCPLNQRGRWLSAFDAVQVNEDEFHLLAEGEEPWTVAAGAVRGPLRLMAVTLGARGAAAVSRETESAHPLAWPAPPPYREAGRPVRRFARPHPPTSSLAGSPDPTGCGDVWGATFFASLLAGEPVGPALGEANRRAGRAAGHRGAEGLASWLSGDDGAFLGRDGPVPAPADHERRWR